MQIQVSQAFQVLKEKDNLFVKLKYEFICLQLNYIFIQMNLFTFISHGKAAENSNHTNVTYSIYMKK